MSQIIISDIARHVAIFIAFVTLSFDLFLQLIELIPFLAILLLFLISILTFKLGMFTRYLFESTERNKYKDKKLESRYVKKKLKELRVSLIFGSIICFGLLLFMSDYVELKTNGLILILSLLMLILVFFSGRSYGSLLFYQKRVYLDLENDLIYDLQKIKMELSNNRYTINLFITTRNRFQSNYFETKAIEKFLTNSKPSDELFRSLLKNYKTELKRTKSEINFSSKLSNEFHNRLLIFNETSELINSIIDEYIKIIDKRNAG